MGTVLVALGLLGFGAAAWLGWGGATGRELRRGAIFIGAALLMLLVATLFVGLHASQALPQSGSLGAEARPPAQPPAQPGTQPAALAILAR